MNIKEKANELGQAFLNAIVSYGEGDNTADVLCNLQDSIYDVLTSKTKVKVYNENKEIPLPEYATDGSVCMDLYVNSIKIKDNKIVIGTGLHLELPENYEAQVRPRSSLTKTMLVMQNSLGTIDTDYRGEVMVILTPLNDTCLDYYYNNYINNNTTYKNYFPYAIGDRCAQLNIHPVEKIEFELVNSLEELSVTKRGNGGFGSTDK